MVVERHTTPQRTHLLALRMRMMMMTRCLLSHPVRCRSPRLEAR